MAKKKEKYIELKKCNKILSAIIAILIILILLGIFAICVKIDVGGLGNNVLSPLIKDVPGINKILPKPSDEQLIEENNYGYEDITQAVEQIKKLQAENDKLKKDYDDIYSEAAEYIEEIERLKEFSEKQLTYEKLIKEFNEEIVFNKNAPDISEYQKYYESIYPDNAADIYRQVIEQNYVDETINNLANTYGNMDPAAAAKAIQDMDDLTLACKILSAMSQKKMAAIMNEMPSEFAADVTEKIHALSKS